jgi:hypothetical protein
MSFVRPRPEKRLPPRFTVLLILLVVTACTAASGDTVSAPEAAKAFQAGGFPLYLCIYYATPTGPSTISYTAPGVSMTGTVATGSGTSTVVETITLVNYVNSNTGYTVNGTIDATITVDTTSPSAPFTGTSTATLTLSGGPIAKETWSVSLTGVGQQETLTFAGTVTCDGTSFDASKL